MVDRLLEFHLSIGEEAGDGVLGQDAIWSHRYYVEKDPVAVPGSQTKVHGYAIQPIDAAADIGGS